MDINVGYKMLQIYSNAMTLCRNHNPWISTLPFPAKWHQCRLAWAGTPHQAHALPRTDAEGDTAQHLIQNAGEIRLYMASMGFQLCTHKIYTHIYILHMYIYIYTYWCIQNYILCNHKWLINLTFWLFNIAMEITILKYF